MLTNDLVGLEALARLKDEEGDFISPEFFIPLAKDEGVLEYITYTVMEKSCQLLEKLGIVVKS